MENTMIELKAETGAENLSSTSFHLIAQDYYKCVQDFQPAKFSTVPYALLCRAIELKLKSRLLKDAHSGGPTQKNIANRFSHDLEKAYKALDVKDQVLNVQELDLLCKANKIYIDKKGFDYIQPEDAVHGYSRFPDLKALNELAKKLIGL
jgi:hypothetical protein